MRCLTSDSLRLDTFTALGAPQPKTLEQQFMSTNCKTTRSFQVIQVLGSGSNAMAIETRCIEPRHPLPNRRYALKVCFNFGLSTNTAQGAFASEHLVHSSLPSHPNIARFMCEFFGEIDDSIRPHLPETAREQSIVRLRDGSIRNRNTQFFVLELLDMTLEQLLNRDYPPPSIVPHRLVAMIVCHIASALMHLERNGVAHRDTKLDNILVELDPDHRVDDRNSLLIKRCVVSDFGTACTLGPDLKTSMSVAPGGGILSSMWGNAAHIAPELHSALGGAIVSQRSSAASWRLDVEMDYSRQSVFELGVVGFEIVTGCHPVPGYPFSFTSRSTGMVEYGDDDIARISPNRLSEEQASILRRAVSCEAARRPSLEDVVALFDPAREFLLR